MKTDAETITVGEEASILETLKAINVAATGFAMVVDNERRLIGVVTDGDVRRAFLAGHDIHEAISSIMNRNPLVVGEEMTRDEMLELTSEKFAQIPVLDGNRRIKGMITFRDNTVLLDAKSGGICILGLGYVGLTLSLSLAESGFAVTGFDIDESLVTSLQNGKSPFYEENVDIHLNRYLGDQFVPTTKLGEVPCDTYIVSVGTPIDIKTKKPNIGYIEKAANSIGSVLKSGDLVVLRSTVPIGTTRNIVIPELEKTSGMRVGEEVYVAYAPERTIEGRAITELRELPQVIGGFDHKSAVLATNIFREVASSIVDVGSLEGSEMVKLLNNTFRDVKFAYANEMAQIGKEFGLDTNRLIQAANLGYVRDEIPVPSPGVGGACLTKDGYLLAHACRDLGSKPAIVELARKVNEKIPGILVGEIIEKVRASKKELPDIKIFIVGFAFKGNPETSDMRGSTTLDVLSEMKKTKINMSNIFGYDPVISAEELEIVGITPATLSEGMRAADVVMFMNNHVSYKRLPIFDLLGSAQPDCIFFDGWHAYDPSSIKTIASIQYLSSGSNG